MKINQPTSEAPFFRNTATGYNGQGLQSLVLKVFALALALAPALPAVAGTVGVNGASTYQTIDGFGAATVWNGISNAQAPVLWTDDSSSPVSNTTAHVNGNAGFSIVRTRIDPSAEGSGSGASPQSSGNWNGELNQVVLARKTNSAIVIFSTPWTPPAADKVCNCVQVAGNTNSFNGLPTTTNGNAGTASADTDYANYLASYVKYANGYLTSQGAPGVINAVSCQNEPDFNPGSYESALWTGPQFDTFVGSYLEPSMSAAGLTANTKIMMTESFHDNLGLAANTMNDATASSDVGIIAGHLYGATNPPPTLASAGWAHLTNQRYWETEISDGSGTAFNATSMTYGLEEAGWIHPCIVDASMNAYNHWWINGTDVSVFYDGGQWDRAFYVEGNYSKFIRPGFVRIGATEFPEGGSSTTNATVWCSAYKSASGSRVVIVAVNHDTNSHTETFNLSGLGTCTVVAPWLTDSSNGLVQQALTTVSGASFSYTLPAQSVMTFVGDCGNPPTPSPSLTITRTLTASPTPSASPTATRTPSPIPTAGPCQYVAAVDCGATAPYTSGHLGLTFGADQQYVPGSAPGAAGSYGYVSWAAGTAYTSTTTITGGDAVDATLYNTQRYATQLGYDFSVPNGQAYVTFYWAEVYATAPGQRVFSVTINGVTEESALDLYSVAGTNVTYSATFPVAVTGGVISVVGVASVNNAEFQGISVQAGPGCSPTPTTTKTWTATPTRTASPTATSTGSATRTASPSATVTDSATGTPPPSPSSTATGTTSATRSATVTVSYTPSPDSTATPSSSATESVTQSETSSQTPTGEPSPTATPTATASASPSSTVTVSETPSLTTTSSFTKTASASASASATSTATGTGTVTASGTPSPTATPNLTGTPSATVTASPRETPSGVGTGTPQGSPTRVTTATATATAAAAGPLVITSLFPVPNPNPNFLSVDMAGPAQSVTIRVYTKALTVALEFRADNLDPGWNRVTFPWGLQRLPNGLYYVLVQAHNGGAVSQPRFAKVLILK